MQSLGLLRLIEKFAEIHRQVSLCSLTTISWRAFVCFFGLNPFQLQNASHSALKLHLFLNGVTLGCCPNPLGASIRETRIGVLSSACGRRARFANAQALLAISAMLNPAQRAHGCNPQTPAGNIVPCTLSPLRWIELGFPVKQNRDEFPRPFVSTLFTAFSSVQSV